MNETITPNNYIKKIVYWNLGILLFYTLNLLIIPSYGDSIGEAFSEGGYMLLVIIHMVALILIGLTSSITASVKKTHTKNYQGYYISALLITVIGYIALTIASQ